MKQINLFKNLFLVALLCAAGAANAQIHPLSFGVGTINTNPNWYANYVGLRFEVVSPASVAGDKQYTTANNGSGATGEWGGVVTSPIINTPIAMPQAGDSLCNTGVTISVDMTGKIGFVYRGTTEFGAKALACQNAGAIACVIVNNIPGAPVGMGAGSVGASVTIPVFMISKADGDAIDALYNSGTVANMTITMWGQNLLDDLGFVPAGEAMWHNYAVPSNQLGPDGNPSAYNMVDGAFIANYGTNAEAGVKLVTTTSFTPTGGIAAVQHMDSVAMTGTFDNTSSTSDSIMAMFNSIEYPLSATGTGRFDVTYNIKMTAVDQYPSDNTKTVSFYVTDSVYSKGTYDFTNNVPARSIYEEFGGGIEFCWGPMYYVAHGGTALSAVQYSLAKPYVAGNPYFPATQQTSNIYIFQWVDGLVGGTADSIVENGELQLVGSATHTMGTNDTSEATLYQQIYTDTNGNNTGSQLMLDSNSWYYVCIDIPATTADPLYLGCDGQLDPYPRVFGRYHANVGGSGNHLLDYTGLELGFPKDSVAYYAGYGNTPVPFAGTAYVNSVDSFVYSNMLGLIPAVSMIANNNPSNAGVKSVGKPLANVSLYPNPAKEQLNVSVAFDKNEKTVTYEIIDGLARFVSKETHNNVQNETYTINTASLASGNYFLIINAEGKMMTRKFAVVK